MAIYELIKNAYDADAKKIDVNFNNIDLSGKAFISIEDDGIGMTSEIIENVWLEPGSDFRKPVDTSTSLRKIIKSPLFHRVPMGEKGIGRFAVHKLGTEITLITRPLLITKDENDKILATSLANYEVHLSINWDSFGLSKHLSDIPVTWKIKKDPTAFRFRNKSGTYIELRGLKENWTKGMAKELKSQTISMLSPRLEKDQFKINLAFDNQWLQDSPSTKELLEEAPYKITVFVDQEFNVTFEYEFSLKNNDRIGKRIIKEDKHYDRNIKSSLRPYLRSLYVQQGYDNIEIEVLLQEFDEDLKSLPFGSVLFEFFSYDLDSTSMRDYSSDSRLTKAILKEHAGIKVFKGDMRVFDYGEKGNDWLGIDLERIQNKEWFSNNQNIGYVYLDPERSVSLIEKTNREGFIHNKSFDFFYIILRYLLTELLSNIPQFDANFEISDENKKGLYDLSSITSNTIDRKLNSWFHFSLRSDLEGKTLPGIIAKNKSSLLKQLYSITDDEIVRELISPQVSSAGTIIEDIVLNITRPCDYSQNKYGKNLKLLSGIIIRHPLRKNNEKRDIKLNDKKYKCILKFDHLYHNDIDDDLTLIFDLRYCFSIPVSIYKKSFDNKKMLNRELLSDIQVTYGNYVSQLGYTKII